MPLTRDQILATPGLATDLVPTPRWGGGQVLVREMPMASPGYQGYLNDQRDKTVVIQTPQGPQIAASEFNIRRHVGAVILCALDPDTEKPMFTWKDADLIRELHWNTVLAIATRAYELAGGDGPDDLAAVDHLEALLAYGVGHGWDPETIADLADYRALIEVTQEAAESPESDEVGLYAVADPDPDPEGDADPLG